MRVVSPIYKQLTYIGVSCDGANKVCIYSKGTFSYKITDDTPSIAKGQDYTYIYRGCMEKSVCESFCKVYAVNQFGNNMLSCFARCCSDSNSNRGEDGKCLKIIF
jgi:hypothetical protein